jgi:hypothetical protein
LHGIFTLGSDKIVRIAMVAAPDTLADLDRTLLYA